MATAADERRAVLLRGDDNVAAAARPIPKGFVLTLGGREVAVREPIALGHTVALVAITPGAPIRKYGQLIAFARTGAGRVRQPSQRGRVCDRRARLRGQFRPAPRRRARPRDPGRGPGEREGRSRTGAAPDAEYPGARGDREDGRGRRAGRPRA